MLIYNARTIAHLADRLAPKIAAHLAARPRPSNTGPNLEDLLTAAAAAALLGVRPATLGDWRAHGLGPRFLRLGHGRRPAVRYRLRDLLKFRDAGAVNPGGR